MYYFKPVIFVFIPDAMENSSLYVVINIYLYYINLNMSSARGVACLLNTFKIAVTNFSLYFVIFDSSSLSILNFEYSVFMRSCVFVGF